mmetsp:Transcript_21174/g.72142  ORF Transcript_21174/g.72142 Transcript_21174/m.72142 type:complete len:400 (+) Transcript_21174:422-1621(+)
MAAAARAVGSRVASAASASAGTAGASSALPASGAVRLADKFDKSLVDDIYRCSFKRQSGVSLKYMMDFGAFPLEKQLLISAQFLHKELPVRLAHRVAELENLPFGLSDKCQVRAVRDWYVESFRDLRTFPAVSSMEDNARFTSMLGAIRDRHRNVVPMIARGVMELKEERKTSSLNDLPEIHQFLDGLYLSRIGIRMLIGQHVALNEPPREGYIGMINTAVSPVEVARDAIADARSICMRQYGDAPEVEVFGDTGFTFAYVPGHLHQMLFELLKNSLRAVADRFEDSDKVAPPIRVVVAEGAEDITVKISDEGGGIPRSGLPKIWTYLYSTARSPLQDFDAAGGEDGPAVLAGYGYGLPLSRLYARYFGGDLQVISMESYGTDAYLHLNRLGNYQEPLP